ncbi:probable methyltransferase-like protein 25 [Uranotaenia lowii]|uniref:probable methyltransferase-like protein 25 n=1 Tax=Uranotaenia lowii TaxID=190385 RepID=UPI00247898DE|nr:probable methyltransferase-like protein 25 [Uranotaenia lowii]
MSTQFDQNFKFTEYFSHCVDFLQKYRWIFEHSNTKFVQEGVLDRISNEWIGDLNGATNEELNRIPLGYIGDTWCEDLKNFLGEARKLSVIYTRVEQVKHKTSILKGVSPKKLYEIEHLSAVIGNLCSKDELLLDFGSGLGYLSQHLHQNYEFSVFGFEGDESRVLSCNQRQEKLFPKTKDSVVFLQHFIEESSYDYIKSRAEAEFKNCINKFAIVGLHACADLSLTAIKMFLQNTEISKLVIMPCCYHKLKPITEDCIRFVNIPVSDELKTIMTSHESNFLGRPFLRLGCQQTASRWQNMTSEEHAKHGQAMFERSLVQSILREDEFVTKNKTNEAKATILDTFKLHHTTNPIDCTGWSEEQIQGLQETAAKYPNGDRLAEYLTCFQTCLQAICENLILLDRLCYIRSEARRQSLDIRSDLVKLANDRLSPRCFIIMAEKLEAADK